MLVRMYLLVRKKRERERMSFIVPNTRQGKQGPHILVFSSLPSPCTLPWGHSSEARVGVESGGWRWGCGGVVENLGVKENVGSQGQTRYTVLYSGEGNGLCSQRHIYTKPHKGGTLPGVIHSYITDCIVGHVCHWLTHGCRISCVCHL